MIAASSFAVDILVGEAIVAVLLAIACMIGLILGWFRP